MPMRVVYEAENLIDAHLVKGMLENEGIPAHVRGEHLTGALGELPVMGLVAVCVVDTDWPEACEVIAVWRREVGPVVAVRWDGAEPDPA
jgi:hypothetical protein